MTSAAQGDGHVHLQLGVFVLSALPADEELAVAQHLVECSECSSAAADLADVRGLLDRLDGRSVSRLLEEAAGSLSAPAPPHTGPAHTVPAQPGPAHTIPAQPGPVEPGPVRPGPARPAVKRSDPRTRPSVRPGGPRRWSRPPRVLLAAVVVTLAVSIGTWLGTRGPVDIQLAGAQTNTPSGVSVWVTVTGTADRARVKADLEGLTVGQSYRLFAVADHGQSQLAAAWTAQEETHGASGDVTIPIGRITEVTLSRSDGLLVVVRLAAR